MSISRVCEMASSGSRNTGYTPSEGTSISATPSCNVHVFGCSTGMKYKLYLVEVVFPPLGESWVSYDNVPPKIIAVVFGK